MGREVDGCNDRESTAIRYADARVGRVQRRFGYSIASQNKAEKGASRMIGYYGSTDRKMLQDIDLKLDLLRQQLATLIKVQQDRLTVSKKILEALQSQPDGHQVGLKFNLGKPK